MNYFFIKYPVTAEMTYEVINTQYICPVTGAIDVQFRRGSKCMVTYSQSKCPELNHDVALRMYRGNV
jgi:hypothetical protein